jgi:hypothetical protein
MKNKNENILLADHVLTHPGSMIGLSMNDKRRKHGKKGNVTYFLPT